MARKDNKMRTLDSNVLSDLGKASEKQTYKAENRIKNPDSDKQNITYFVTRATHRRMKSYALDNNVSMQAMINEAMDLFFAEKGEPPIDKWPRSKDDREGKGE